MNCVHQKTESVSSDPVHVAMAVASRLLVDNDDHDLDVVHDNACSSLYEVCHYVADPRTSDSDRAHF
jgi:hypothetical protein